MAEAGFFRRVVLVIIAMACLAPLTAGARSIRVDRVDHDNYTINGQEWASLEQNIGATGDPRFAGGTLPFALNFGTGPQTSYCFSEDSEIWFDADCTVSPGDLGFSAGLIEPLAADWIANAEGPLIFDAGTVTFTAGQLSRVGPSFGDLADAPRAVRFHWNNVLFNGLPTNSRHRFQAILIQVGSNGDFDLELNYANVPADLGSARFSLGANTFQSSGPFPSTTDFDFQFRNGILVNGPSGTVPEPGTIALLLGGLVVAALVRRRRSAVAAH